MKLTNEWNLATSPLSIPFCMLKYPSHVRHLELVGASEENLQDVFKHMTNLESLSLKSGTEKDNYAFTGQDASRDKGYSIKRLQKLEYLNLDLFGSCHIAKIIQELQLPRLKHFILWAQPNDFADLRSIFLNMPSLESLKIFLVPVTEDFENIIKSCELAKNLIYLCIKFEEASLQTESSVAPLFKACPSLRFLHFSSPGVLFSFNPHTKKISMLRERPIPTGDFIIPRNVILHKELFRCMD